MPKTITIMSALTDMADYALWFGFTKLHKINEQLNYLNDFQKTHLFDLYMLK